MVFFKRIFCLLFTGRENQVACYFSGLIYGNFYPKILLEVYTKYRVKSGFLVWVFFFRFCGYDSDGSTDFTGQYLILTLKHWKRSLGNDLVWILQTISILVSTRTAGKVIVNNW